MGGGEFVSLYEYFNELDYKPNQKARILATHFDFIMTNICREYTFAKGYKRWLKIEDAIPPTFADNIGELLRKHPSQYYGRITLNAVKIEMKKCLDFVFDFQ